jgi:carotenoid cleavage dioxygenase-like enzyme
MASEEEPAVKLGRRTFHASDLAVFDKGKITRGPIATMRTPQRVPYGFHGTWLPGGVPR